MRKRSISTSFGWLLLFGLLNLFASGRWSVAAAAWLSPIFGLYFLHTYAGSGKRRFLAFYLVTWVTLSIAWFGATPIGGAAHFVFMAVNALFGSLPFFFDRWLLPKIGPAGQRPFWSTLIFPMAVTGLEFLTISGNPIGNFGATGYSQYGFDALLQITAVTGMLGLTFLISWFAAVIVWAWLGRFHWQRIGRGVAIYAVVLLLVLGYGVVRLQVAPDSAANDVQVTSFTLHDTDMGYWNELISSNRDAFRQETQAVHTDYLAESAAAAQAGANIILWPEMAVLGVAEDVDTAVAAGQLLARERGVYLAMPTFTLFPDSDQPAENVLYLADPAGEIVIEHVKYGGNMIEGTLAGDGALQVVETPYGRLTAVICWDTNFPGVIRQAGQQDVDILLSPALEWAGINPMHGEMATFRGRENGLTVIRQADKGLSLVSDPYGRTLATATVAEGKMTALVASEGVATIYPAVGDWLGIVSLLGLVLVTGGVVWNDRRQAKAALALG